MQLNLLVLRCKNIETSKNFYEKHRTESFRIYCREERLRKNEK